MRTLFTKTAIVSLLILTSNIFISCKKKVITQENQPVTLALNNPIEYTVKENISVRNPIVFITGYDKGGDTYYKNARSYFKEQNFEVIDEQYSVEEIINWLNTNDTENPYGEIHIVNKSNPYKGLSLETVIKGETVNIESLRRNITMGALPILNDGINSETKIIFHADGLGENEELMNTIKDAFCADQVPNVIASPYVSIFDGKFTPHYLAKAYYVFYPTANSPGKVDLSKEIAKKYAEEKDIDWYDALNNSEERFVGDAYTKQMEIPIKFELDFHNSDEEVPGFDNQEELIDFITYQDHLFAQVEPLNIPLDKFRWTYSIKNSKLTIKGKTTGLCVLLPLIKPYGELEHIKPDTNNKRLYAMK